LQQRPRGDVATTRTEVRTEVSQTPKKQNRTQTPENQYKHKQIITIPTANASTVRIREEVIVFQRQNNSRKYIIRLCLLLLEILLLLLLLKLYEEHLNIHSVKTRCLFI